MYRKLILSIIIISTIGLGFVLWFYNHQIVSGDFTRLTITVPDGSTEIVEDQKRIESIINKINESPRKFGRELPLYRYEIGILTFENVEENKEKKVAYMDSTGNLYIRYGEVETGFSFMIP